MIIINGERKNSPLIIYGYRIMIKASREVKANANFCYEQTTGHSGSTSKYI